ncbi:hypothetical protein JCM6882_000708 [Rhodosporidiobolus microsporus]
MPAVKQTLNPVLATKDFVDPSLHSADLKIKPLEYSGALDRLGIPREELTPALGDRFPEQFRLKEILALPREEGDPILRDIAILISYRGVVFFANQDDIVPEDIGRLALRLGELAGKPESSTLHIHPTQDLSETGLPLGKISSEPDADGRQISFKEKGLTSAGWHSDVAFEPVPSLFTILQMHTIPRVGGDTLWSSNYSAYDRLSPKYQQFLEGLTATNDAERFRIQARLNGFKLRTEPRGSSENQGDDFYANHPIIRTNPVTGLRSLYLNPTFTTRINELGVDESRSVLDYLFRVQHENHENHVKYRWSPRDVAIWNNGVVNHLATFDFTEYRAGDRAVVVGEKPFFDPASISREQYLHRKAKKEAGKA